MKADFDDIQLFIEMIRSSQSSVWIPLIALSCKKNVDQLGKRGKKKQVVCYPLPSRKIRGVSDLLLSDLPLVIMFKTTGNYLIHLPYL